MFDFPDVSSWQWWLTPKLAHFPAWMVKATQGIGYKNPDFYAKTVQIGMGGFYHFWEMTNYALQADNFLSMVTPYLDGSRFLVLDYEPRATYAQVVADIPNAERFVAQVEASTGLTVIPYLNNYFAGLNPKFPMPWSKEFRQRVIWYAGARDGSYYTHIKPAAPFNVDGWGGVIANQWTDSYTIPGFVDKFDMNVFFGDTSNFLALCQKTSQNGLDPMITIDDIRGAITDCADKAVRAILLDNTLIWTKDENGKVTYQANIRRAITDIFRRASETDNRVADLEGAIAGLSGQLKTLQDSLSNAQPSGGTPASVQ